MRENLNRRQFLGLGAAAATATLLLNCSSNKSKNLNLPPLLDVAPDGELLKAGVIGCGGRGTGAALDFLNAGPNLTITALGDVFQDRLEKCATKIKQEKGIDVPESNRFGIMSPDSQFRATQHTWTTSSPISSNAGSRTSLSKSFRRKVR